RSCSNRPISCGRVLGTSPCGSCSPWSLTRFMSQPNGFSWVEKPLLAALARPEDLEELVWLRRQGIDLLISLTEDPPRRDWVDDAGLLLFHVPMIDMAAPDQQDLDRCISAIVRAHDRKMGVAIHCGAGL